MNGARAIYETLAAAGVSVCFANPGTTEVDLVHALDDVPAIDTHLVLHEAVATGAADGYGRMAGRPATTLLHLGPGYANGAANLHNAWRARTPVVNVVGDHATWHRPHDTGLASDIEGLASVHSERVVTVADPGPDTATALGSGGIVTLVVPADVQRAPAEAGIPLACPPRPAVPDARVEAVVGRLRSGAPTFLLLDGPALVGQPLRDAGAIAAASRARLVHATLPARVRRGHGEPVVPRLPYAPDRARALIGEAMVVTVGAHPPTTFFGYDGVPSHVVPAERVLVGADPDEDVAGFLAAVAEAMPRTGVSAAPGAPAPEQPGGPLDVHSVGAAVAWAQPEDAIVVNAAVTSGGPWEAASAGSPPHDMLTIVGGSLGFALPASVGAAIAAPGRRVIALVADGSALYTPQALWNLARGGLDVTVVALVNRRYRIIAGELSRVRDAGPVATDLTDIGGIDFVALGEAFGVPSERVADAGALAAALEGSVREPGPSLIEVSL